MRTLRSLIAFAFLILALPAWAQTFPETSRSAVPNGAPTVKVVGDVKLPALVTWKPGLTVLDALLACGGLSKSPEEPTVTLITDSGRKTVVFDLVGLLDGTLGSQNLVLKPADVLIFSCHENYTVYIDGAVVHPGSYSLPSEGIPFSELLRAAGGPTEQAALSKVQIISQTKNQTFDLRPNSGLAKSATDILQIFVGDTIYIPTRGTVDILGAVLHPGEYLMPDGEPLTVAQALQMAGGQTPDADGDNISLSHLSGSKRAETVPAGVEDVLMAGDMLTVPSKATPKMRTRPDIEDVRTWLITGKTGTNHD